MTSIDKYNTFGKRFLAGLVDGMLFIPFSLLDTRLARSSDKAIFIAFTFSYIICWMLYVVISHGKYGQTIGKRLMNIKVLDLQEQSVIGYKKAFYREAVWFFAATFGLIYFLFTTYNADIPGKELRETFFDGYVRLTISMWLVLELVTMFFNKKRRALHDYIAGCVVVDVNEMKRENLQNRHEQWFTSVQSK